MKDAEILRERLASMDQISGYVGEYFSRTWVMKNVLMLDEKDIEEMVKEIETEAGASGGDDDQDQDDDI